jgi:hypothetical protein
MPPRRLQIESEVPRARLRPSATPVDTFVQSNEGEGAARLAQALAGVAPSVGRLADVLGKRDDAAEKERGEQAARKIAESGKTYQQAIKDGLITPDQSPWFRLGAKEQFGRVTADKFATDLSIAAAADPKLQESVEPADFDAFAVEFRKAWLKENVGEDGNRDLHFENGFGPRADAYLTDARRQFGAQAGQRLVKAVGDQQYQEQFGVVEDGIRRGLTMEAMAEGINLANDRALATGLNPRVANEMTVQAVVDIAMRERNPAILEVLKKVRGGSGFLYGTKQAQEKVREATDYISAAVQRDNVARRQEEAETRAETERTTFAEAAQAIISAPDIRAVDLSPFVQVFASQGNTGAIRELTNLQDVLEGEKFETHPEVLNDTLAGIWTPGGGVTMRRLVGLLNNKQIDPQAFSFLAGQIQSRDSEASGGADDGKDPNRNIQYRDGRTALRSLFVNDFAQTYEPDKQIRANRATAEFTQRWLTFWNTGGAAASSEQRNAFILSETERLANKYGAEETRPADKPNVPGAPRWMTEPVTSSAHISILEQQLRSPAGLSNNSIQALQRQGVGPETVMDFLREQRRLLSPPKKSTTK